MEVSLQAQKLLTSCGEGEGLANRIASQAIAAEDLWIGHCLMDFFPSYDTRRRAQDKFFFEDFDGTYHDAILDLLFNGMSIEPKICTFELTCLAIAHPSFSASDPFNVDRGLLLRFLRRRQALGEIYKGSFQHHLERYRDIFEADLRDAGDAVGRWRCILWFLTSCMRVDFVSLVDSRSERVIESYPTLAKRDIEHAANNPVVVDVDGYVPNGRLEFWCLRKATQKTTVGRRVFAERELRRIDQQFGLS